MDTAPPRGFESAIALCLTAALVVGVPLFLFGWNMQPASAGLLGAGFGFVNAGIGIGMVWLTRSWPIHEFLRWIGIALLCGVGTSVLMLYPFEGVASAAAGLILMAPIAAAVATVGYALDGPIRRNPLLGRILIALGGGFVLCVGIAAVALEF